MTCIENVNITCIIRLGQLEVFKCIMKDCYLGDCITEILRLRAISDDKFHSFTYHDEEKNRYERGFLDRDKPVTDLDHIDILDYKVMIIWHECIKVGNHSKIRKRSSNCFDVLIKPISSCLKMNSNILYIALVPIRSEMIDWDLKDQLIKLLAWNQDCDIETYRLMSKCILNYSIRSQWRGLSLNRRLLYHERISFKKSLKECFNYHYYAWGRLYYLLKESKYLLFDLIANTLKELCLIEAKSSFITYQLSYCNQFINDKDDNDEVPELVSFQPLNLGSLLGLLTLGIVLQKK